MSTSFSANCGYIITIDGPAGAGKSTTARSLARLLHFDYLDTGAMFRAVGLVLLARKIPLDSPDLVPLLAEMNLEQPPGRMVVDGEDVTDQIRTPEVSSMASRIAVVPAVRACLAVRQREIADGRNIVCEGRDQGTVVFPHAFLKVFLTADPAERASRRHKELAERGQFVPYADVLAAQIERDERDSGRSLAPTKAAADAFVLDTTHLSIDGVLNAIAAEFERRRACAV